MRRCVAMHSGSRGSAVESGKHLELLDRFLANQLCAEVAVRTVESYRVRFGIHDRTHPPPPRKQHPPPGPPPRARVIRSEPSRFTSITDCQVVKSASSRPPAVWPNPATPRSPPSKATSSRSLSSTSWAGGACSSAVSFCPSPDPDAFRHLPALRGHDSRIEIVHLAGIEFVGVKPARLLHSGFRDRLRPLRILQSRFDACGDSADGDVASGDDP